MSPVTSMRCRAWLLPWSSLLAGCAGAPSHNILGSYFPSWILCAVAGLILTIVAREALAASRLDQSLPLPAWLLLAVALSFAVWLAWIG
jgi:hypothetical protein